MSDDADRASESEALHFQAALHNARRPTGPQAVGRCLSCDEDLEPPLRWCSVDCRDEWERRDGR